MIRKTNDLRILLVENLGAASEFGAFFPARFRFIGALLIIFVTAAGCNFFDAPRPPETARLFVESPGPLPIRIITSNNFISEPDPETGETTESFITADTIMVTGQHVQNYPMGDDIRFLAHASVPGGEEPQKVFMRVLIDDVEQYNFGEELLEPDFLEYFFIYY